LNKSLLRKGVHFLAACLAFSVVLMSASRGAVVWGLCAIIFFLLLNRHRKYLSGKNILIVLLSGLLLIPIVGFLYSTNYALAERVDILVKRFTSLFYDLTVSGGHGDDSLNAREMLWNSYFMTFDQWILFGEKGQGGYPHNQWLEIFVKFGLLGIPLFFMSVFVFVRLGWDTLVSKRHPDVEFSLIATLFVFSYLQSMTSLSLQVNRALWLGFGYLIGSFMQRRARLNRQG
jgi:O-antigen ligase